jgi:hypothetical protein
MRRIIGGVLLGGSRLGVDRRWGFENCGITVGGRRWIGQRDLRDPLLELDIGELFL